MAQCGASTLEFMKRRDYLPPVLALALMTKTALMPPDHVFPHLENGVAMAGDATLGRA